MLTGYGPIRQLGYVVRDIEAAMEAWATKLRIGPWFYNPRLALQTNTTATLSAVHASQRTIEPSHEQHAYTHPSTRKSRSVGRIFLCIM